MTSSARKWVWHRCRRGGAVAEEKNIPPMCAAHSIEIVEIREQLTSLRGRFDSHMESNRRVLEVLEALERSHAVIASDLPRLTGELLTVNKRLSELEIAFASTAGRLRVWFVLGSTMVGSAAGVLIWGMQRFFS